MADIWENNGGHMGTPWCVYKFENFRTHFFDFFSLDSTHLSTEERQKLIKLFSAPCLKKTFEICLQKEIGKLVFKKKSNFKK
jgi:hypothetical protein